jgi:hypothetical protein
MHLSGERYQVVLAHGENLDVLHNNYWKSAKTETVSMSGIISRVRMILHTKLVVIFLKDSVVNDRLQVLFVAFCEV